MAYLAKFSCDSCGAVLESPSDHLVGFSVTPPREWAHAQSRGGWKGQNLDLCVECWKKILEVLPNLVGTLKKS